MRNILTNGISIDGKCADLGTGIVAKSMRNRAGDAETFEERSGRALGGEMLENSMKKGKTLGVMLGSVSVKYRKSVIQKDLKKTMRRLCNFNTKNSQEDAHIGQRISKDSK